MRSGLRKLTLSSLFTALTLALLFLSSALPVGKTASLALSGLLVCAAVIHCGIGYGAAVFAASGLLSILLVPDKENVILYLVFIGYYPLIKSIFERFFENKLAILFKLAVFNAAFALLYIFSSRIILDLVPEVSLGWGAWQVIASVIFVFYDLGLTRLIGFYMDRAAKWIDR